MFSAYSEQGQNEGLCISGDAELPNMEGTSHACGISNIVLSERSLYNNSITCYFSIRTFGTYLSDIKIFNLRNFVLSVSVEYT